MYGIAWIEENALLSSPPLPLARQEKAPLYIPPKTRPDLTPSSPNALTVAEEFNEQAHATST